MNFFTCMHGMNNDNEGEFLTFTHLMKRYINQKTLTQILHEKNEHITDA